MRKTSALTTKTLGRTGRSGEVVRKVLQRQAVSKVFTEKSPGKVSNTHSFREIPPELLPDLDSVNVTDTTVFCQFEDGRTVSFPLQWSDKLAKATASQRQAFDFNAHFIFWDEIDEIIGVRNILLGKQLR